MKMASGNLSQYGLLSAIVLLALVSNLALMPLGNHYDIFLFQSWGNRALIEGLPSLYQDKLENKLSPDTTNHPPLHPYLLKFEAWLNYRFFQDVMPLTTHYLVISKLIACLCNIVTGLLIYFYVRSKRGIKMALLIASIYLLNPALIYNISYWGQADAIGTLLMLLSLLLLLKNRPTGSTICLTLGVLVQLRTIIIFPVLILIIIKRYNFRKIISIVLISAGLIMVICLPYLVAHQTKNLLKVVTGSPGMYPYVNCSAANLWYLISPRYPFSNVLKDTTRIFGVSLGTIGLTLFISYSMIILYQLHKSKDVLLASAAICFAFFMLPTEIHSRYLFPFFALFALSINKNKIFYLIFIILSITYLLNLMMILPFQGRHYYVFSYLQSALDRLVNRYSINQVLFYISIINLLVFIVFSHIVIGQGLRHHLKNDISRLKGLFLKYKSG